VESLLGLRLAGERLYLAPCLPADWQSCTIHYRYRETVYHIVVTQTHGGDDGAGVTVDGIEQRDGGIPLIDDRRPHSVEVMAVSR
jgi:cellobiose phosphorylase